MFVPVCDRPTVTNPMGPRERALWRQGEPQFHGKIQTSPRLLPITGSAHKTGNGRRPLPVAIGICPKCQGSARAQWLAERQAELLTVPYFPVVSTIPAPARESRSSHWRLNVRDLHATGERAASDVRSHPPAVRALARPGAQTRLMHERDANRSRRNLKHRRALCHL